MVGSGRAMRFGSIAMRAARNEALPCGCRHVPVRCAEACGILQVDATHRFEFLPERRIGRDRGIEQQRAIRLDAHQLAAAGRKCDRHAAGGIDDGGIAFRRAKRLNPHAILVAARRHIHRGGAALADFEARPRRHRKRHRAAGPTSR